MFIIEEDIGSQITCINMQIISVFGAVRMWAWAWQHMTPIQDPFVTLYKVSKIVNKCVVAGCSNGPSPELVFKSFLWTLVLKGVDTAVAE